MSSILGFFLAYHLTFYKVEAPDWINWAVLVIGTLCGLVLGTVLYQTKKLASAAMAAYTGISIGTILFVVIPINYHNT